MEQAVLEEPEPAIVPRAKPRRRFDDLVQNRPQAFRARDRTQNIAHRTLLLA